MAKKLKLNAGQSAQLFAQLHRLETAGLPAVQAFDALIAANDPLQKPLLALKHQLGSGLRIADAGFKAGLFDSNQRALIHAAEASGQLAGIYRQLAQYYASRDNRLKKIKSRLFLPGAMLAISLFVQPIPALVAQEITLAGYLWLSVGRLLTLFLGMFLLAKLPAILENFGLTGAWHRLQLRIPSVAKWLIRRQINDFLTMLGLMLESGLPFAEALPKAVGAIKNSRLRSRFKASIAAAGSGKSVSDVLNLSGLINPGLLRIVHTSEQSGKLGSGVLHFTRLEAETIHLNDETLAEWLPRIAYAAVAVWMAYSILTSQIGTIVPDTL